MSAPSALVLFNAFGEHLAKGTIDCDTDTLKLSLVSSAYAPNVATHAARSDFSASELATAFGYTSGGASLTGVSASRTVAVTKVDAGDVTWTASGGSLVARYAVLYANVTRNGVTDPLIGYLLLDSAPADVTATSGDVLTVIWNASGIFTITA